MTRWLSIAAVLFCCLARGAEPPVTTTAATQPGGVAILQEFRRFREMGSVLYVAAHPDDENTQLITYLARGRGYRTAYLSVTRGDGGQNVLGGEFGPELGLIRTNELLSARQLDGGRQFFTRAIDFGFSKDYRETLKIWDHQQVLADVVRVIRTFRPDVVITRFSPEPGNTHGHHTASAVLAVEAFKIAGDASAMPDELKDTKPWKPKRLLMNGRGGGSLSIDVSGNDAVTGESFARIASRSRGMHKSQGFGGGGGGGGGPGGGARAESFQLLDGEPADKDIMDGVETTWKRIAGGDAVATACDALLDKFDAADPSKNVAALLKIREQVAALPAEPLVDEKRKDLDRLIADCLGISVSTTMAHAEVVAGEAMPLRFEAHSTLPVRWVEVKTPRGQTRVDENLAAGGSSQRELTEALPPATAISQPYWLREEPAAGTFRVDDPTLIGRPLNPPVFAVQYVFEVDGKNITLDDEPVERLEGTRTRRLAVIPPVSLRPTSEVRLFSRGESKTIDVELLAARANVSGTVRLQAPSEWKIEPSDRPFKLGAAGDHATVTFNVTAPHDLKSTQIGAVAEVNGAKVDTGRVQIDYPHIPPLLLQPKAIVRAVCVDLAIRGKSVGYLSGAGDSVADALKEMGYDVTQVAGSDLTPERLKSFDAIVVGVRAMNVRTDLADGMAALFAYVENGGTVVMQYNRPEGLKTSKIAPYDLRLSNSRVTDENAAMTLLDPQHPAFNVPNKITPADFDGWVQERGIYFPNQWNEHFTPLLACNDPGEQPLEGGLLVAKHGKGYFVYTGLVFFRELPAGVPGAYRLMANLVSLGK